MASESVKQKTIASVKWTAIEKFGLQGMQFFLSIIMARLLSPSDYGTVGMIAIFLAVSNTFIDSGFGSALIRKLDRTEIDFSTVFYFNLAVSLLCYILLFVSAPFIADFFKTPILCVIVRVQSVNLVLGALMQIQVSKLTIDLNFRALSIRSLIATFVSGIVGIIMAYKGWGVWALVYQSLLAQIINLLFVWLYCKWIPRLIFSWSSFTELGSFGSKLLVSSLLNTIYNNMTTIVIGKYFSAKDIGYYNRGIHFAKMPVDTMNSVLGKVTYPIFAQLQNDNVHLIRVYRKYIRVMSIPIFFGCVLLAALARPVILLLLTDKWLESVIYLQIYTFAIMFNHITSVNLTLLQVKGRSGLFLKLEIIKKTIAMVILFSSIPFGVIGICLSKILYTQIAVFVNTYYTGKMFNLGYITQFNDFGGYLLFAIFACTPTYLFTLLHLNNILTICLGAIVSSLIFYFLLRKDPYFIEMQNVFAQKLHLPLRKY